MFIELSPYPSLHPWACDRLLVAGELGLPGVTAALAPLRDAAAAQRGNLWWLGQVYEHIAAVELTGAQAATPGVRTRKARKARGSYYTPPVLASWLARASLGESDAMVLPRVLDPAMGAGAFLLAAVAELERRRNPRRSSSRLRRELVQECLFGVELDPLACRAAELSLQLFVGKERLERVALRQGDALWGGPADEILSDPRQGWRRLFPEPEGGFDLVLCNPPYLGEQGRKALFQPLRALYPEASGPRMDYWYFFVGLALRLVRAGGAIGMLTPSYWLRARGARTLRATLRAGGDLERWLDFGRYPVFEAARGQHSSVWLFRQGKRPQARTLCCSLATAAKKRSLAEVLATLDRETPLWEVRDRASDQLLAGPGTGSTANTRPLGALVHLRQGIVPNPDRVSPAAARQLAVPAGTGVFLLSQAEVSSLGLRPEADGLLVPAFRNSDIRTFAIDRPAHLWLLYLRSQDALSRYPAVQAHLERFRPLLERRREVRLGRIAWYSLHWPRLREHFERPRLVTSNWGNGPRPFALEPGGCFERRDVTSLHLRSGCDWSLDALLGFLSSACLRGRVDALQLGYQRQAELAGWPLPARKGSDPAIVAVAEAAAALRECARAGPLEPGHPGLAQLEERVAAAYRM